MSDDYPILVNGVTVSARQHRERQRIEHDLRAVESDLASIELLLGGVQERSEVLRHTARMAELRNHLARLRAGELEQRHHRRADLVYKVTYNARLPRRG